MNLTYTHYWQLRSITFYLFGVGFWVMFSWFLLSAILKCVVGTIWLDSALVMLSSILSLLRVEIFSECFNKSVLQFLEQVLVG